MITHHANTLHFSALLCAARNRLGQARIGQDLVLPDIPCSCPRERRTCVRSADSSCTLDGKSDLNTVYIEKPQTQSCSDTAPYLELCNVTECRIRSHQIFRCSPSYTIYRSALYRSALYQRTIPQCTIPQCTIPCYTILQCTIPCCTIPCCTVSLNWTTQCSHILLHCSDITHTAMHQYSTVQYNAILYSTVQYNPIHCNAIQYNRIHCTTMFHTQFSENNPRGPYSAFEA